MRRTAKIPVAAALALLLVVPAFAGQTGKLVELTGYITAEWCEKANAEAACTDDCAITCSEKDSEVVIYSNGKRYRLDDRGEAVKHIGHKVVVRGTVDKNDVVKVKSIEKARRGA